MNEVDLVMFASEVLDRMWSLIQWWGAISFGLLAVAHIAASKIGTYLAVLVSVLYSGFTFGVFRIAKMNAGAFDSILDELEALQAAGVRTIWSGKLHDRS